MAKSQDESIREEEVRDFLDSFVATYEKGDPRFFDLFSENATIYTISSPTRIDGAAEFRRGFQPFLESGQARRSQILSPEIQISGATAVVTYHNRIQVDKRPTTLRSSLVLSRNESGRIQAVHLHNSPLESPSLRPSNLEELKVLEESVATTIGAVGTPK